MKRKLTCLLLGFCMLFSAGGVIYASNGGHQEDREEKQAGELYQVIKLSAYASHVALHTSYTRTVHRQGIKHIVKYEALPKSQCPFCKLP